MPAPIAFPSPEFDHLLTELRDSLDRRRGGCLLVVGEGDARHLALGRLAETLHVPYFQIPLDTLYSDRPSTMLAGLREAFDGTSAPASVLCFDYAGVTIARLNGGAADESHLTAVDYLFERARHFQGLVVICVRDPKNAAPILARADVVVQVSGEPLGA